ncbi:MAG: hypothetical protein Q9213_001135 [Squamulea squamosa]
MDRGADVDDGRPGHPDIPATDYSTLANHGLEGNILAASASPLHESSAGLPSTNIPEQGTLPQPSHTANEEAMSPRGNIAFNLDPVPRVLQVSPASAVMPEHTPPGHGKDHEPATKKTNDSMGSTMAVNACTEEFDHRTSSPRQESVPATSNAPITRDSDSDLSSCELPSLSEVIRAATLKKRSTKDLSCGSGSSALKKTELTTSAPGNRNICDSVAGIESDPCTRKRQKKSSFKSPLPLMEHAMAGLSQLNKTKRSGTSDEDGSIERPISLGLYCDDQVPRRSKRRRTRKPDYTLLTDDQVLCDFEELKEKWLQAERQLKEYKKIHDSFAEFLQGLGYVCKPVDL